MKVDSKGNIIKPSEEVRKYVKAKEWKQALRIAKGFRLGITKEQKAIMTRAYECMIHPEFYEQLGTNVESAIADGIGIIKQIYG